MIGIGHPHPGGMNAWSRWLSEAPPPDPRSPLFRTPAGVPERIRRRASLCHASLLPARFFRRGHGGHLGVEFQELFQPFGVVLEAAAEVDALERLVVALEGFAEVGGHFTGS